MSEQLLSTVQVMQRLNVSRTTLHYLEKAGTFPPRIKIGRAVRFRESDVDTWIRRQAGEDAPRAANAPPDDRETAGPSAGA